MSRKTLRWIGLALSGIGTIAVIASLILSRSIAIAQPNQPENPTTMTSPTVNPQLVTAHNQFGFKLFQQLMQQERSQNVMVSPTSVAIALSMLYNGAEGETQQQMATALELQGLSLEALNQSSADLEKALESADPNVKLAIANSLWGNRTIAFKPDFLDRTRRFYSAEVEILDFADANTVPTINSWVSRNTEGKIPTILDAVSPDDAMFLINAVYFKGQWQQPFNAASTSDRPFTLLDGSTKNHPLMNQTGNYLYQESNWFQAVNLPYGNGRLSMVVFLPQSNVTLEQFYQEFLSHHNWDTAMTRFTRRDGTIQIPRFKYEYYTRLNDTLKALGMTAVFDPNTADLTGLTDQPSHVDEVRHKTFIEVNEEGTEAAAVTSIGIRTTSIPMPTEPFTMTVDRPFFYVIRDNQSGAILFMGSVVDPQ